MAAEKFKGERGYAHDAPERIGVLIANLGTPDEPTTPAVRRYLREFLSDPRVIEMPKLTWWLVLNGIILRLRPKRSAAAYATVWGEQGSPLLRISLGQRDALAGQLERRAPGGVFTVALGMRYGSPAIATALDELRARGVRRLLVLPMYPQYSATTVASVFDALADELRRVRWLPDLRFVSHYHDHDGYLDALAESVREDWQRNGRGERLLLSFHGIPQRYFAAGDPYHCECHKTARLLAKRLDLGTDQCFVSFQSRVGREAWLKPYTDKLLEEWGAAGVGRVDVLCPGFSADCLETLEEIALQNDELFREAGGGGLHYIPALNDRPSHVAALADLVMSNTSGWHDTPVRRAGESEDAAREGRRRLERARALGAKR